LTVASVGAVKYARTATIEPNEQSFPYRWR
jgi:hypothetical protein